MCHSRKMICRSFVCLTAFWVVTAASPLVLNADEGRADEVSEFDTSKEGWVAVDYPFRSHKPNADTSADAFALDRNIGQSPPSLRVGWDSPETGWDPYAETGVAAPARYLGDNSSSYGRALRYSIFIRFTDGKTYPAVVLNGGEFSLYFDAPSPALHKWESRTVVLTEVGWKRSGTHTDATKAEFQAALANLQGLYIYTEWAEGRDDTNIDNVYLQR